MFYTNLFKKILIYKDLTKFSLISFKMFQNRRIITKNCWCFSKNFKIEDNREKLLSSIKEKHPILLCCYCPATANQIHWNTANFHWLECKVYFSEMIVRSYWRYFNFVFNHWIPSRQKEIIFGYKVFVISSSFTDLQNNCFLSVVFDLFRWQPRKKSPWLCHFIFLC